MDETHLAERFEAERPRLRDVAYRLLGSASEAEDAVQECWLRLSRADSTEIANFPGWLTTVTARICLDMLRSRQSRREAPLPQESDLPRSSADPENEAVLAESVGHAMATVLERLDPAERVAFVLHDVFSVPFNDIAPIVGRSPVATRQLASRARKRVQAAPDAPQPYEAGHQRHVVEAFFQASRNGDFQALLAVLDPGVVLRPDAAALEMGTKTGWITSELRGPEAVARQFFGQALAAQVALIDGVPGATWAPGGKPKVAFAFVVRNGLVVEIELIADPELLAAMEIEIPG